jgi:hypothetical protein
VTAVRDIWADLVDKRLWPLAVVLVIALVALPVLVLKPAPSVAPPPPPTLAAETGAAAAQPAALVTDPAAVAEARSGGPVGGKFKNPFAQQHIPKPKAQPKASATAATTAATATPAGGSGTSSSGGSTGALTPSAPVSKPKPRATVTKLKVRFGPSNGKRPVRELAPGTPVPSVSDPLLVFVDVDSHGQAEFVVASEVQPQGDGRCTPSRAICAQLFMKFGDTEFLDVTRSTGTVQFQLDVLGVVKR